ncbi:hypothetical protein Tsubulata_038033 [Turnera subulata]|uniref:RING-type domain-containing protein n=1 Tax=Turnera subulata TaxID=218843 RepID=A0A9Q0GEH0_9ROSI|nr:hypothetical protein Tsubulata_038033 [Turnera subulata]
MRHGVYCAPFTPPSPSPSPTPLITTTHTLNNSTANINNSNMLVSVFLALFLPCAGMSAVFIVYICLLWYATNTGHLPDVSLPVKPATHKGLSPSELDKLPKVTGKDLVLGMECAVCLDDIEAEQPARLVPGCNHGFHLECADTWLSKHSVCPVCRAKLDDHCFGGANSDDNPC